MRRRRLRMRDLFAGAGGWDVAAHTRCWTADGVEIMPYARATRDAAGLVTIADDVRDVAPVEGDYDVDVASPPCQSFSMAGSGAGRQALTVVLRAVDAYARGRGPSHRKLATATGDERTALVLEPLRVALGGLSTFLAWEQVPTVLPIWQACAPVLEKVGYSVAVGVLSAEQYGVPQTRRRAVLVARRDGRVATLPTPTHSRYHVADPARLDPDVSPWVSMAEALGWGLTGRPSMTVTGGGTATGGAEPFGNGARQSMAREAAAGRWLPNAAAKNMGRGRVARYGERPDRPVNAPAFTVRAAAGGAEPGGFTWVLRHNSQAKACVRSIDKPAGTLAFGHARNEVEFQRWREVRKMTPNEAALLQTFPDGYPFQGGKCAQMLQIGNAIPPLLAAAIFDTFGRAS